MMRHARGNGSILPALVSTHHLRVPGFVELAPAKNQRKEGVAAENRKSEEAEQVQEVRDSSAHVSYFTACINLFF
jgi:hypothetical protein